MTYTKRIRVALAVSLVLHLAVAAVASHRWPLGGDLALPDARPPVVLRLQPLQPEPPRQVVASVAPAEAPVNKTPLIAETDSKAQSPEGRSPGDAIAPPAVENSEFFELGGQEAPPAPAARASALPAPKNEARLESKPKELKKTANTASKPRPTTDARPLDAPEPPKSILDVAKRDELSPLDLSGKRDGEKAVASASEPAREDEEAASRASVADLAPAPSLRGGKFRGSVEGDVAEGKGFLAFEAMKSEIAPYMMEIRRRVERHWRAAMTLKYSGTTPTKAVIDCAISPEGELLYVTVVEPGSSVSFAPLCKESIEKAGPFPPFPFKVPDIYRNKNLEIHWTFNFL